MNKDRLETLIEMKSNDSNDSFVRYALAKEYELRMEPTLALLEFESLKSMDPEYVGLYYHLGKLLENMGQTEKALATYGEGIIVCKKLKDFHALTELNTAKVNLEMEL